MNIIINTIINNNDNNSIIVIKKNCVFLLWNSFCLRVFRFEISIFFFFGNIFLFVKIVAYFRILISFIFHFCFYFVYPFDIFSELNYCIDLVSIFTTSLNDSCFSYFISRQQSFRKWICCFFFKSVGKQWPSSQLTNDWFNDWCGWKIKIKFCLQFFKFYFSFFLVSLNLFSHKFWFIYHFAFLNCIIIFFRLFFFFVFNFFISLVLSINFVPVSCHCCCPLIYLNNSALRLGFAGLNWFSLTSDSSIQLND